MRRRSPLCGATCKWLAASRATTRADARGVRGDRQFAVRSADGKLGSGKNSRRFRHIEGLFTFRARLAGEWPEITFPDGRRLRADDPAIDSALTAVLGTPVTLAREEGVLHFDDSPIHLVSTASLQWLQSRCRRAEWRGGSGPHTGVR